MTEGIVALFLAGGVVGVPLSLRNLDRLDDRLADRLLGGVRWAAIAAILALAVAFAVAPPLAGILALPWLILASVGAVAAGLDALSVVRRDWRAIVRPSRRHAVWAALVFLAVGAAHVTADRFGVRPFGFAPTIVLLTGVHFHIAGFVLLVAGLETERRRPWIGTRLCLTSAIIGIPVTAIGFFGVPAAALLGALLVSVGGAGIGVGIVRAAGRRRSVPARWLARIAGLSLLVAMPLAAAYAIGQIAGASWLDIPTMARTHGALNVIGFAIPVAVAMELERRAGRATPS